MNDTPTHLYVGRRNNIIAEVGGLAHIYEGKYLAAPYGEPSFDCIGANSLKELDAIIAEHRAYYPNIIVCRV